MVLMYTLHIRYIRFVVKSVATDVTTGTVDVGLGVVEVD
jgi:hypothetical protein